MEADDYVNQIEQEQIEVDRLITECMTAQGFTYIPPDVTFSGGVAPTPESSTDRDHAAEWGFGILPGLEAEQPWLVVMEVEDVQRQLDGLEAQTQGEGESYNVALYGSANPRFDVVDEGGEGCRAEAIAEINRSPTSLAAQTERMETASKRMAADPRTVELDAVWARCMNELGHDFSRPEDIHLMLVDVLESYFRRLPSVSGSVKDVGDGPVQVAPDPALVAAFESDLAVDADRERDLAVADIGCRTPLEDEYQRLRQEYFEDAAE